MIEFIIINENESEIEKNRKLIEKEMMNYEYDYQITTEINNSNQFKVYIIDYSTTSKTIRNRIKTIRKEDWVSMIILTTIESKIKELLTLRCMPVDMIIKDQEYEKYFLRAIHNSIKNLHNRPNQLKYEYKKTIYHIPLADITYIDKCKEEKVSTIHTTTNQYNISKNITQLEKETSFIRCNRSTLVNIDYISQYNKKESIIKLKNNIKIEIARDRKKEVTDKLRKVD